MLFCIAIMWVEGRAARERVFKGPFTFWRRLTNYLTLDFVRLNFHGNISREINKEKVYKFK